MGVVMIHVAGIFMPDMPSSIMRFIYLGPNGVMVFFVLSAFTIAMSLDGQRSDWLSYAIKRFFRIAPAYYVMLLIVLFGRESSFAAQFETPFDLRSFIYHLTFFNWIDFRHANNALGVEWTLSIEVLFYMLLPVLIWASRSTVGAVALLVGCLGALLLTPPTPITEAWKWSPAPYAICFAAGVVTYKHWQAVSQWPIFKSGAVLIVALAVAIIIRPALPLPMTILWWSLITCALIFSGRSMVSEYLFSNRVALWFGERSYSLYLVHLPLLVMIIPKQHGLLGAIATLALTLVSAYCLHRWVERPGISVGRLLIQKLTAAKPERPHPTSRQPARH